MALIRLSTSSSRIYDKKVIGSSKAGIHFGGKHAEAIFCANPTIESTKKYTAAVRAKAVEEGRDPASIKFFLGIMPIIGRTIEEAEGKFEKAKKNVSVNGGLAGFCGFTNVDLSEYAMTKSSTSKESTTRTQFKESLITSN